MPNPNSGKREIANRITPAYIKQDEQRTWAARQMVFSAWLAECKEIHDEG